MRAVLRLGFLGAAVGLAYGALIATLIWLGAVFLVTAPLSLDAVLEAGAMALFIVSYGLIFGGAVGLAYGFATALIVAGAGRLRSRWSPHLAAAAVFVVGQIVIPDRFTGDAPFLFPYEPDRDALLQLVITRTIPSAIAALVAWRATTRAR